MQTEWSDVALDWVRRNTQINLDEYPTRIMIVPRGPTCAWGGMGYVGCHNDCRVWIQGDLWDVRGGPGVGRACMGGGRVRSLLLLKEGRVSRC